MSKKIMKNKTRISKRLKKHHNKIYNKSFLAYEQAMKLHNFTNNLLKNGIQYLYFKKDKNEKNIK